MARFRARSSLGGTSVSRSGSVDAWAILESEPVCTHDDTPPLLKHYRSSVTARLLQTIEAQPAYCIESCFRTTRDCWHACAMASARCRRAVHEQRATPTDRIGVVRKESHV